MPLFRPDDLLDFSARLMTAVGTPPEDAAIIARHCVDALLLGEENHGMELGTQYIPLIRKGLLKPGAPLTVIKETPTTLMVDGGFNFGHVVSHTVMNRLIDKAREHHVAAASIRYQTHVGRLIDYTSMASDAGMIALMMTDGAWGPKFMAPHGGTERRLGINPWSMTLPNDTGGPVGFDMTSGAVSLMKVQRARDLGQSVPEGWILDADGRPTTNPADFFAGGSMLPMGGGQAHKGYALTFMIEALADVLSGMDYVSDQSRDWPVIDGCFMAVFDVSAFRPLAEFTRDLDGMIDWVTSSPPAPDSPGVFYPGQRSRANRAARLSSGVPIPDDVWAGVCRYADELDVDDVPLPMGGNDRVGPHADGA